MHSPFLFPLLLTPAVVRWMLCLSFHEVRIVFLDSSASEGSPWCSNGLFTLSALHYFLPANTKGPCHRKRPPKALKNVTYIHSSMDRNTHTQTLKQEHKVHTHQHLDMGGSQLKGRGSHRGRFICSQTTPPTELSQYGVQPLFQSKEDREIKGNKRERAKETDFASQFIFIWVPHPKPQFMK